MAALSVNGLMTTSVGSIVAQISLKLFCHYNWSSEILLGKLLFGLKVNATFSHLISLFGIILITVSNLSPLDISPPVPPPVTAG